MGTQDHGRVTFARAIVRRDACSRTDDMARVSSGIRIGVLCLALLLGAAGASRPGRPSADRSRSPHPPRFSRERAPRSSRDFDPL
jgi:hypothetical protein